MTGLPDELEQWLGPIVRGWPLAGDAGSVQVVQHRSRQGLTPFSTLGLSRHLLSAGETGHVRQELMIETESQTLWPRNALAAIADQCEQEHAALMAGSLVTLGPIEQTSMEVLFASRSVPLSTSPHPVAVVTLVPITAAEAERVRAVGPAAWQQECSGNGVQLGRLDRQPTA